MDFEIGSPPSPPLPPAVTTFTILGAIQIIWVALFKTKILWSPLPSGHFQMLAPLLKFLTTRMNQRNGRNQIKRLIHKTMILSIFSADWTEQDMRQSNYDVPNLLYTIMCMQTKFVRMRYSDLGPNNVQ